MNFKKMAEELVSKMTVKEKLSQMKYNAPAIERLGIPAYNWWSECLHGAARNGTATVFPQVIGMAASFNKSALKKVGAAISDEVRAKYNANKKQGFTDIYQGLTMCSPNINIFRDPRWGRGHETFGEDPTLTGMLATEFVKGLQGSGKYRKADATLKHYAVHSGPEAERRGLNVNIDRETMDDTYLAAFKYCVENANPSAVMGAYNAVNGEPCTASKTLLVDILRGEYGFNGFVMSDAAGVEYINQYHGLTADETESAAMAVNLGCELCIGDAYENLGEAYERGLISDERINEAVERLFEARFRLGMFADDCEYDKIPYSVIDCKKHKALNLKVAEESIVLLKNDGILPLDKNKKIAVIGPNADNRAVLIGNYNGTPSSYTTLLSGIQKYASVMYARGCNHMLEPNRYEERTVIEAVTVAKMCDVVVMCMGITPEYEGEEVDQYSLAQLSGDKATISLPKVQMELYEAVKAVGKPIVFVNVSGSCMALGDQKENCNAVIQCFYPGARGGEALANILFGKISPSGRLPVTFYEVDDDLPSFRDYSMENRTYKYFSGTPVFEFGHGLTYSDVKESWIDENTVEITNNGPYNTAYSVLKFETPAPDKNKKLNPKKVLRDFAKVNLKVGEKKTVKFN